MKHALWLLGLGLVGCQTLGMSPGTGSVTGSGEVVVEEVPEVVPLTGGFCVAEVVPALGLQEATLAGTEQPVYLHTAPELVVADITHAYVTSDNQGRPAVAVEFTSSGARKLARITRQNVGKKLAVYVAGDVVALTPIQSESTRPYAFITGDFSEQEAARIAEAILGW